MNAIRIDWPRVLALYLALAAAIFVAAFFAHSHVREVFLVAAACLVGAFFPGIMAIYFFRGFLSRS